MTHSASHFVIGNVLGSAADVSLCLCVHPAFFNMYRHTLVPYKHLLALRVLVTDILVLVKSFHRCIYSRKTALLQRELKAPHNFPVTNCTLSRSTLIAEVSTTRPGIHTSTTSGLLLDASFLFSFYLSGSQPFTFLTAFYFNLDHRFPCRTKDAEPG